MTDEGADQVEEERTVDSDDNGLSPHYNKIEEDVNKGQLWF